MDSIDYFDKRLEPKKGNKNALNEWNLLKKDKKILQKKNEEAKLKSIKNDKNENKPDV